MIIHYRLGFFNESGYAGLENDQMNLMLPTSWLPAAAKLGSRLTVTIDEGQQIQSLKIAIDEGSPGSEEAALIS